MREVFLPAIFLSTPLPFCPGLVNCPPCVYNESYALEQWLWDALDHRLKRRANASLVRFEHGGIQPEEVTRLTAGAWWIRIEC